VLIPKPAPDRRTIYCTKKNLHEDIINLGKNLFEDLHAARFVEENGGNRRRALNEAAAATLLVNAPEAFLFLPLVDDAHRCEEQQNDDRHVAINRAENIVEGHISERGDGCDAEVAGCIVGLLDKRRVRAELTTNYGKVGRIEVTTALELVLDLDPRLIRQVGEDSVIVGALLEGVEPDEGADHDDKDTVDEEDPVEEDKTTKNMSWLNNCADRNGPGYE